MVCIYCRFPTQVNNSRHQKRSNTVWRRRKCKNTACSSLFSTREATDYEKSWVVQYGTSGIRKSAKLAPFIRDKLFISIYKSCQHRKSSDIDAVGLTATVINQLQPGAQDATLSSTMIAATTYKTLQRFDNAAATYYHAFHSDVIQKK